MFCLVVIYSCYFVLYFIVKFKFCCSFILPSNEYNLLLPMNLAGWLIFLPFFFLFEIIIRATIVLDKEAVDFSYVRKLLKICATCLFALNYKEQIIKHCRSIGIGLF